VPKPPARITTLVEDWRIRGLEDLGLEDWRIGGLED